MYKFLLTEVRDRMGIITINRPTDGNTMSGGTAPEMEDAIDKFSKDESVGVIIITGAGKNFCVGGDINSFKSRIENKTFLQKETILTAGTLAIAIRRCPKPIIAMINGSAAGAGCGIAMACDFRIMEMKSKFAMAFANLGLSGDTCGMYFIAKLVGVARMTEMLMYSTTVNGTEALTYGLANRVAEPGNLQEVTFEFAKKLAYGPTFAYKKQKELFNRFFYSDMDEFLDAEADAVCECGRSSDFTEAVYAFLEKRKPEFKGK